MTCIFTFKYASDCLRSEWWGRPPRLVSGASPRLVKMTSQESLQRLLQMSFSDLSFAHISIMAIFTMSTMIPRASLPLQSLRCSSKAPRVTPQYRGALHQSTRPTSLTAFSQRPRPLIRPASTRLAPEIAGSVRTIFIQTENTPNVNVSIRPKQ